MQSGTSALAVAPDLDYPECGHNFQAHVPTHVQNIIMKTPGVLLGVASFLQLVAFLLQTASLVE